MADGIIIRPMTSEDTKAVSDLEKECFSHPWSQNAIEAELSNSNAHFFVAVKETDVCGYIGCHIILDECYIANVAVSEKFRRQGIGRLLTDKILTYAKDKNCAFVSLEVRKSNISAISLYEKQGFEFVGERKNFYSDPTENAYIMTKEI